MRTEIGLNVLAAAVAVLAGMGLVGHAWVHQNTPEVVLLEGPTPSSGVSQLLPPKGWQDLARMKVPVPSGSRPGELRELWRLATAATMLRKQTNLLTEEIEAAPQFPTEKEEAQQVLRFHWRHRTLVEGYRVGQALIGLVDRMAQEGRDASVLDEALEAFTKKLEACDLLQGDKPWRELWRRDAYRTGPDEVDLAKARRMWLPATVREDLFKIEELGGRLASYGSLEMTHGARFRREAGQNLAGAVWARLGEQQFAAKRAAVEEQLCERLAEFEEKWPGLPPGD